MRDVVTLVLGGGQGTRLYPLTKYRSKPAVPIAGKYRLIDIPLSNCINSGLNRCYVITQFNSVSLHRHIRSTYNFDAFEGGFVEILAAQQTLDNTGWYQGTADAVRQNLRYAEEPGIKNVLILSGDQLYRIDFRRMIAAHEQSGADVTIAAVPVPEEAASSRESCEWTKPGEWWDSWKNPKPSRNSNWFASILAGLMPMAWPAAAATAWPTWGYIFLNSKP
jgi:glucose-1-phosphate adenylyltransferase